MRTSKARKLQHGVPNPPHLRFPISAGSDPRRHRDEPDQQTADRKRMAKTVLPEQEQSKEAVRDASTSRSATRAALRALCDVECSRIERDEVGVCRYTILKSSGWCQGCKERVAADGFGRYRVHEEVRQRNDL